MRAILALLLLSAPPQPVQLTVVGDSLALGVGAPDTADGFAFRLFRRVRENRPGSEVTNLAISGATAADALRLEVPRVAPTRPDVVLVCVGANDVIRFHSHAAFARDYARLVAGLRRAAPAARIVLFNIPDVTVSPIFDLRAKRTYARLIADDNAALEADARRSGALVVDLFALTRSKHDETGRFLSSDQFHPSGDGHAAIAREAWPVLEDALGVR